MCKDFIRSKAICEGSHDNILDAAPTSNLLELRRRMKFLMNFPLLGDGEKTCYDFSSLVGKKLVREGWDKYLKGVIDYEAKLLYHSFNVFLSVVGKAWHSRGSIALCNFSWSCNFGRDLVIFPLPSYPSKGRILNLGRGRGDAIGQWRIIVGVWLVMLPSPRCPLSHTAESSRVVTVMRPTNWFSSLLGEGWMFSKYFALWFPWSWDPRSNGLSSIGLGNATMIDVAPFET